MARRACCARAPGAAARRIRLLSWLLVALLQPLSALAWEDGLLGVPIVIDGRTVPYPVFAIYATPRQEVNRVTETKPAKIRHAG